MSFFSDQPGDFFGNIARAITHSLGDNGAVRVEARVIDDRSTGAIVARVSVSDMVPSLEKHEITLNSVVTMNRASLDAFVVPLRDLYRRVADEREARRWSACDL